jgi:hypothetical protein
VASLNDTRPDRSDRLKIETARSRGREKERKNGREHR